MQEKVKSIIGRAERISIPTLGNYRVHARIDTGAKTSSIWATDVHEENGRLYATFRSNASSDSIAHHFSHFSKVAVSSSMGTVQTRYKVKLTVVIKKRRIISTFTLADRSMQVYPVLIGRNTLMNKFIVDVAKGSVLKDAEELRSRNLQSGIEE